MSVIIAVRTIAEYRYRRRAHSPSSDRTLDLGPTAEGDCAAMEVDDGRRFTGSRIPVECISVSRIDCELPQSSLPGRKKILGIEKDVLDRDLVVGLEQAANSKDGAISMLLEGEKEYRRHKNAKVFNQVVDAELQRRQMRQSGRTSFLQVFLLHLVPRTLISL